MYIIGKKLNDCSEVIRNMIGDSNIYIINNYFNNYYDVCYKDQDLKVKMDVAIEAERLFQSACYDSIRLLPYLQFARFNSLARELDRANDELNEQKKELELSTFNLSVSNSDIKDSNVYERLEKTHNLHAFCKYMNPYGADIEDEDMLLDLVLNNELDLIKDYLDDYRSFNFDIRLAKKRNTSFINHDINNLDLRLKNLILQNAVIKEYQKSDVDASIIYEVIKDSYDLLNKSLTTGVSKGDIDNYTETLNFEIKDKSNINDTIRKYVATTKNDILEYGKVLDNCKKKVK